MTGAKTRGFDARRGTPLTGLPWADLLGLVFSITTAARNSSSRVESHVVLSAVWRRGTCFGKLALLLPGWSAADV